MLAHQDELYSRINTLRKQNETLVEVCVQILFKFLCFVVGIIMTNV